MQNDAHRSPDNTVSVVDGAIVCILAGGGARRMGATDKAQLKLGGRRLVDIIIEKLKLQARMIVLSAPDNRQTELPFVPDCEDGPKGPAAGLFAVAQWLQTHYPSVPGFFTVPVDGPLFPLDLIKRLAAPGGCAIAADETGAHPTFAYWEIATLRQILTADEMPKNAALHAIATKCGAQRVFFEPPALMNINTPADLVAAKKLLP